MTLIYGHRWASAMKETATDEAAECWLDGLAGVTQHQVAAGIRALRRGDGPRDGWPPTLPQFRELCLGVPTLADCKARIGVARQDRSAFDRLVWHYLDSHRFRRADQEAAERLLRDAYDQARAHVLRLAPLPPESPAVTHERAPAKPAKPETVESEFATMARALGISEEEARFAYR